MNWTVSTVPPVSRRSTGNITMKLWRGCGAAVTGSTGSATCRMVGTILPGVEACGKTGTAQNRR